MSASPSQAVCLNLGEIARNPEASEIRATKRTIKPNLGR